MIAKAVEIEKDTKTPVERPPVLDENVRARAIANPSEKAAQIAVKHPPTQYGVRKGGFTLDKHKVYLDNMASYHAFLLRNY